jgi:hypothetical protein
MTGIILEHGVGELPLTSSQDGCATLVAQASSPCRCPQVEDSFWPIPKETSAKATGALASCRRGARFTPKNAGWKPALQLSSALLQKSPLGLGCPGRIPQGSSCLATLGCKPESLWDSRMERERHGVRRQSGSGDGAFGRTMMIEQSARLVRAKAVSRCACHRSPRHAGAFTVTFEWREASWSAPALWRFGRQDKPRNTPNTRTGIRF